MAFPRKPIFNGSKAKGPVRNASTTVIVDCSSVGYASYYGCREKLEHDGQRTEVIYSFLTSLLGFYKAFGTKKFAFAFDSRQSYRKKKYPWYKRRDTKVKEDDEASADAEWEALFSQFRLLRQYVLPTMGFTNILQQRGVEADDLIASAVMNNPKPMIAVSTDEDLFQLLNHCDQFNHRKKEIMTRARFEEVYQIKPEQWVEVKKLAGCSSDKIPGIPRVGEKTAISFLRGEIKSGKTLDGIQSDMSKSGPESIYERNAYLVTLPIPETKVVQLDFENEVLSLEGFYEVCHTFAFRLLDRSTRDDWLRLFKA